MSGLTIAFVISLLLTTSGQAAEPLILDVEEILLGAAPFATKAAIILRSSAFEDDTDGPSRFPPIAHWQFQFFDSDNNKVDFVQGRGTPNFRSFLWRGITRKGQMLKDGFYSVRFVWNDAAGAPHKTRFVKLSVITPPGLRKILDLGVDLAFRDADTILRLPESLTFARGQATLKPSSFEILTAIANFLLRNPNNRLGIQGYTDNTGTDEANERISTMRALAVYDFFADKGLDTRRMTYVGLGPINPIDSNVAEASRAKNRRVEIVVRNADI
ncbi:MAG: OmpA family protein [Elusimicrobiota bacterium]